MPSYRPARIRLGGVAFLLSGLLIVIATILRGPFVDPSANPAGFAHWVTSPTFFPGAIFFLMSLVLQIFGIISLYAFLASGSLERLVLVGMILTIVTDALLIAVVGAFAFIFPTIGTLYLQGQQQVIEVAVTFGTSFMVVLLSQAILFSLAALVISVAVWRSGTLPKWSALTYALAGLILAFAPPLPFIPELIGTVLFTISVGGITWGIWQHTAVGQRETELSPTPAHSS
jgi:hypothetical protein